MDKDEILHFLQAHKDEFAQKYDITEIALFGSYAKGSNRLDSDIDIAIDMDKKTTLSYSDLKTF